MAEVVWSSVSQMRASCGPWDGSAVLFGFHAQTGYAGGFTMRINVELKAINGRTRPRVAEKNAHVCLSHVSVWAGHT